MRLSLFSSSVYPIVSQERRRLERAAEAAEVFEEAFVCSPDDRLRIALPVQNPAETNDTFARSVALRDLLGPVDVVHCLDFEGAADLSLAGVRTPIILGSCTYPSLHYQDNCASLCHETLATLIEREERVLRRMHTTIVPNLRAQQHVLSRGVGTDSLKLVPDLIMPPAKALTSQSLGHFVYIHQRRIDASVIYESLLRLKFPWRLSVLEDSDDGIEMWRRDARVKVFKRDQDWQAILSSAMIALCGGSRSRSAETGFNCPQLALWASACGVTVLGTENVAWRNMLGEIGLIPPDRPDLMSASLTALVEDVNSRLHQHQEICRRWEAHSANSDVNALRELWMKTLTEKN